ncbi:3-deoxy-manno-octulosonate cytidylyltransferase (CMP-KDO synthetase) [Hymenobacter luteus]|uniref:3-deoxy-manno-octulosonate cytidylyltransferase n=2 Tax=Hymenobacter TaxID=89966 RepID=A0A7W9T3W3_9BACT|nr:MULTISPECIES: 3-deoxy-manno-octulosonate cytidylyltransferase [Hymenobacter]MBB4601598.1 3-deoxy-manno-octulosonate cytidylyltransferase (CMP-KDO synthetase) [Hymenobacter latericoloratus]MBB6059974.1 3-deoxy-manno-octulosonate cytidylyltransferase (CMP-KDO synthetase) [Hymenobacter luteus]
MQAIGIIPARYASTRLPGKPLVDLAGQSMIQRVVAQARQASLSRVIVATDDERILAHVRGFGGEAVLTSADHPSGTDRIWDAYQQLQTTADCIINIQGDEPFIHPAQIDALVRLFDQPQPPQLATLVKPVVNKEELFSPHLPKVVRDAAGHALYFSRHPLPYQRQQDPANWLQHHRYLRHIGLYAYRPDVLAEITQLPPSALELAESLEQLRWLEHGYRILTAETELETIGIDTPEDVERALRYLRAQ